MRQTVLSRILVRCTSSLLLAPLGSCAEIFLFNRPVIREPREFWLCSHCNVSVTQRVDRRLPLTLDRRTRSESSSASIRDRSCAKNVSNDGSTQRRNRQPNSRHPGHRDHPRRPASADLRAPSSTWRCTRACRSTCNDWRCRSGPNLGTVSDPVSG